MAVLKKHGELLALLYPQIVRGRQSWDSAAVLPTAQAYESFRQKTLVNRMVLGLCAMCFAGSVSRQLLKVFSQSTHEHRLNAELGIIISLSHHRLLRNTTAYTCKRVRVVEALVHTSPPDAPTAGDVVIASEFGFTTWLARL